jgi:gliding motility-associated-like protein
MNKYFTLPVIILFALLPDKLSATHSMGADLTYQCLGGNTYQITLSFYRDCIGISAPSSVFIDVSSNSCSEFLSVTLTPIPGTGQDITPICPSQSTTCNGGTFTGIQEWVYTGTITLPTQCSDWVFSYDLCCRNQAITTISSPLSENIYIYSTLNNIAVQCNNSPTFTNKPVPFVCLGQQFCFNHGAFDADGDSLVYSLITPLSVSGFPVQYLNPYSATQPLNSVPAMTFDSQSGDFCITPQSIEVTVMAVLVEEYRNGVLIGSVERDIQVTVIQCSNIIPVLTGIDGTNNFSATICADAQFCFDIFSNDPDAGQQLTVTWDNSIVAGSFNTGGTAHPTGTFCWTPTQNDVSGTPHCFTVTVTDDACPYNGSQVFSYCLTVVNLTVDAGPNQSVGCSGTTTIQATPGTPGNYSYSWSNGSTSASQTVGPGTYTVTVSNGLCTATDQVTVSSSSAPTANFTTNSNCQSITAIFTDNSSAPGNPISSWSWNFGDGSSISSQQNPSHTFSSPGTYNVCLQVTSGGNCVDTVCQQVTISQPVNANFTAGSACAGTSVSFTNTSQAGSNANYSWNFGNGSTSTSTSPSVTYSSPGNYTVTLIASDGGNCPDTVQHQVTINPLPFAAFTSFGGGCAGPQISFNNTSIGNITSWLWDFGNGQTSSQQNPSPVTYASGGTYSVTLTVTTAAGCTSTINSHVSPGQPFAAGISPPQSVCPGAQATLTATGGSIYQWNTGATSASITVSPASATTYSVIVADANGCSDTVQVSVGVYSVAPVTISPDVTICAGQPAAFIASAGSSYSWNTGQTTQSINVSPSLNTNYIVTVTDVNGCTGTASSNAIVNVPPVISLSDQSACPGDAVTFDAGIAATQYSWSTGGTNQSVTVSQPGPYTITVTDQNGCTASATASLIAFTPPVITITPVTDICVGDVISLTAGGAASYSWMPAGTTSTISGSPVANSSYMVTGTDNNGCTSTASTSVNVHAYPSLNIPGAILCAGSAVTLDAGNSGNTYLWNTGATTQTISTSTAGSYTVTVTTPFGCASSQTVQVTAAGGTTINNPDVFLCQGETSILDAGNPGSMYAWNPTGATTQQITVNSNGLYSVTITDANGCSATVTTNVVINQLPQALFTANNVCSGNAIQFNDVSVISSGSISQWEWAFGDNYTSTQQSPSHLYSQPGTYSVQLIVYTNNGCSDTTFSNVTVHPLPVAFAGNDQVICRGQNVVLNASGGGTYLWTTGAQQANLNLSPQNTASYGVTVTDANGCTDTDSVTVTVNIPVPANAGPDQAVCAGSAVTLNSPAAMNPVWNPGNITSSSVTLTPAASIAYTLTVTDNAGCSATDTVNIFINPLPVANAGNDITICPGDTTLLTAMGGGAYLWMPGNLNQSVISVHPPANAVYTLLVTDANGCQDIDSVNVLLNQNLSVIILPAAICPGSPALLDAGNPGCTYNWSTGQTTQQIQTTQPGNYSVTVTSSSGCTGIGQATVAIHLISMTPNPLAISICQGNNAMLDALNPGNHFLWSTGDTTQSINAGTSGTYSVIVTDNNGCTIGFTSTVNINPLPVVLFTATSPCQNDSAGFVNNSSISSGSINSYSWNFGDGNNSSTISPTHLYTSSGNFNVSLLAVSDSGCSSTSSIPVTIYASPVAAYSFSPVCEGNAVSFADLSSATNDPIISWQWNFDDGNVASVLNPSHAYVSAGLYNASLVVTSVHGCMDSVVHAVNVYPLPLANAGSDTVICAGTSIQIGIPGAAGDVYNWTPTAGLLNSSSAVTTFTGTNTTDQIISSTYVLSVTSSQGCQANDTINLAVKPVPSLIFTAPQPQCLQNNSFSLSANGSVLSGLNVSWDFGMQAVPATSASLNPAVSFLQAGSYNVALTYSANGCPGIPATGIITVNAPPVLNLNPQNLEGCAPLTVLFSNGIIEPSTQYYWSVGNETIVAENFERTFDIPGTYIITLQAVNSNGCVSINPVQDFVKVHANPEASFIQSAENVELYTPLIDFRNTSMGGEFYNWDFGDGQTASFYSGHHSYNDTGIYMITLITISPFGCRDTAYGKVYIDAGFSFYVPNAFTPNGDGDNDFFQGIGTFIKTYKMSIYDRWGLLIYQTDDYDKPWDGRLSSPVQSDTYVYRINLTDFHDKEHVYIGHVTLVR